MARCQFCSAPLRPNNLNCEYCGSRSDLDLHGRVNTDDSPRSDRLCPNCNIYMQSVNLNIDGNFYVERCDRCYGMYFDLGELEEVLEHEVSHDDFVNEELLTNVTQDRYQKNKQVMYKKCPVCKEFMARRTFGYRSGVIVDRCNKHGLWLDSGELIHLLEWKKAGGEILDAKDKQENPRKPVDIGDVLLIKNPVRGLESHTNYRNPYGPDMGDTIGDAIASFLTSIFRR